MKNDRQEIESGLSYVFGKIEKRIYEEVILDNESGLGYVFGKIQKRIYGE